MPTETASLFDLFNTGTRTPTTSSIYEDIEVGQGVLEERLQQDNTDKAKDNWQNLTIVRGTIDIQSTGNDILWGKPVSLKEKSFVEKAEQHIFRKLYFPPIWEEEGVARPNMACKEMAVAVCKKLYKCHSLYYDKVVSSKLEGIYIRYDYVMGNIDRSLIIEVYNTLEIASVVSDNIKKEIIISEDIKPYNFKNVIRIYKKDII